jgi:hypothetical protein
MLIMQSIKNKNINILLMIFVLCTSYCKAEEIDFKNMESSGKQFNERQSKDLVIYMSLETMFSGQHVRALAAAAGEGRVKKVADLVAQGVDINSRGTKNSTPLFWALRNLNFDGFKKLLDLGADPNIIFADGSVMHWAAKFEDTKFLREALIHGGNPNLVAGKTNETPLFETIGVQGSGNKKAMIMLLDAGSNINAVTGGEKIYGMSMGGKTPIMVAANVIRFDIVYELLSRGADYSLKDDTGRDLRDRIIAMNGRFNAGSEQGMYLEQVISLLSERGVKFPRQTK